MLKCLAAGDWQVKDWLTCHKGKKRKEKMFSQLCIYLLDVAISRGSKIEKWGCNPAQHPHPHPPPPCSMFLTARTLLSPIRTWKFPRNCCMVSKQYQLKCITRITKHRNHSNYQPLESSLVPDKFFDQTQKPESDSQMHKDEIDIVVKVVVHWWRGDNTHTLTLSLYLLWVHMKMKYEFRKKVGRAEC